MIDKSIKLLIFPQYFQVFKPPNPWTMAIMNVLAELHQEPDLKLNLKFEIEVLCKNLNIDVLVSKMKLHYFKILCVLCLR